MANKYLELVQPNIDSNGLIANNGGDEGDSSQREGSFAICIRELYDQGKVSLADYLLLRQRYWQNLLKLQCGSGSLRRGLGSQWWSQDCVMSRDQWTPNAIAVGSMDLNENLWWMIKGHLKRGLCFATNTCPDEVMASKSNWKLPDLTVLSSWGYYIRSLRAYPLWPALLITDLELLANSIIIVSNSIWAPTNTDVSNHVNSIIQAKRRLPTPISWIARQILKLDRRGMQACLDAYFSPSLNAPALNKVYADLLPEVMK